MWKLKVKYTQRLYNKKLNNMNKCTAVYNKLKTDSKMDLAVCDSLTVEVVLKQDFNRIVEMCTNHKCRNYYICRCGVQFGNH